MSEADSIVEAGRAVHRQGALDRAAEFYRKALSLDPGHALATAGLGVIALQTGDVDQAATILDKAARLAPGNPTIQNNLGNALIAAGDLSRAEAAFDAAFSADPSLIDALYNRAVARQRLRRRTEAEADYRTVLSHDPMRIDAAVNLAAVLREAEDPSTAISVLESALQVAPPMPDALMALASLYETVGRVDEAGETLDRLPSGPDKDPQVLLVRARIALRRGQAEAGLAALDSIGVGAPAPAQRQATYLKGLLLDRLGRYEDAFQAFSNANAQARAGRSDADKLARSYRDRIAVYRDTLPDVSVCAARLAKTPPQALPFDLVFFCGFPRSGTTLMEQILAAHPATLTTGEDSPLHRLYESTETSDDQGLPFGLLAGLTADRRDALRVAFADIVESQLGDCRGRTVIDKLPLNLVELGIVALLFPEARILVAIRDPRDCVLSAFMQPFRLNEAMACLLTPQDAAALYADVFDLYQAQKHALPLTIAEYRYEDLIDDFEGTLHRVIDFLGLAWTDDLTRYRDRLAGKYISTPSYMAVSQSLNRRAIGRWRRYEPYLGTALDKLSAHVTGHGYD
ncbi:tetratricopeptide repeat-containing sulfotransferase family protein [Pacificispira sp.]|uniref:tetratricopeptide repeat-containing sulfotransferase family protein n=1 Tax=Pacificispira sp. TaxID=2888761 RepID=UPI003B52FA76